MTREEALEILERLPTIGEQVDALEMAIGALEQSQWIPVTERLPEEDGLYFVTTSKGQVQVHMFSHNGNSKEYWMRCNKAWMPLPEPWGGDTE